MISGSLERGWNKSQGERDQALREIMEKTSLRLGSLNSQDKNSFEMILISETAEEAEKAGDEGAYKDNGGRGEN